MKKIIVRFAALFILTLAPAQAVWAAPGTDFVTGQDWTENMSPHEKYIALVPPAVLFSEYDVQIKLSLPQYMYLIDRILERNPQLSDEDVSSIFASTVYLFEPQTRPALRSMEMNFLRGDFSAAPDLRIDGILDQSFIRGD